MRTLRKARRHAHTCMLFGTSIQHVYVCVMRRVYGGQLVRHVDVHTLTWQNSHEISVCGPSTHTIATITRFGYSVLFPQLIARLCRFILPCRHSVSENASTTKCVTYVRWTFPLEQCSGCSFHMNTVRHHSTKLDITKHKSSAFRFFSADCNALLHTLNLNGKVQIRKATYRN